MILVTAVSNSFFVIYLVDSLIIIKFATRSGVSGAIGYGAWDFNVQTR